MFGKAYKGVAYGADLAVVDVGDRDAMYLTADLANAFYQRG
jgi:hypothetical protein